jgi:CheY-like chemotaxis protein/DNA-binding CsgD family transcriptional regulator
MSHPSVKDLVLVVDDSPDTLGMLNDALEQAGMTTLVALEGRQALSIARKMAPDIILLDAIMPNMDGFETCAHLKADPELQAIPVIFMTGLADTDNIVKGFEAGGVDYVTKPIRPIELIARIKVHLTNARATLSAQTALDTAGQNICAVTRNGELQWATPQAVLQLEQMRPGGWKSLAPEAQLKQWLDHEPTSGMKLACTTDSPNFMWSYVGKTNVGEYLLKLSNEALPKEADLLKKAFAITGRAAEVLEWIAKGKTNREIAQILELSPRTVNKHLEQVFKKMGVENRTTAATMAVGILQKNQGGV